MEIFYSYCYNTKNGVETVEESSVLHFGCALHRGLMQYSCQADTIGSIARGHECSFGWGDSEGNVSISSFQ